MPKLGVFSGEEICRILETEGFLRVRQKGSHTILQKRTEQVWVETRSSTVIDSTCVAGSCPRQAAGLRMRAIPEDSPT